MEMITPNVYTETKIRGCNPSIVFTKEGSVFVDTAQWISTLFEMRKFALERGPIRYLINTEAHIDHIFGNHWLSWEIPILSCITHRVILLARQPYMFRRNVLPFWVILCLLTARPGCTLQILLPC